MYLCSTYVEDSIATRRHRNPEHENIVQAQTCLQKRPSAVIETSDITPQPKVLKIVENPMDKAIEEKKIGEQSGVSFTSNAN